MTEFPGVALSRAFRRVLEQAEKVARFPRPVLIRGERGTGKELLARHIHALSRRADGPFVAVNCAAFTDTLLGSEFYGHERGAFTGAERRRIGRLEQADGGTLFLDEIGNMPQAFQEKILRVIEYPTFERVGGSESVEVDVRVISATNADLQELMADGLFRRDLYDRLSVAVLDVPPLRQRREDIPRLIVHFVRRLRREIANLPPRRFLQQTVEVMVDYYWPGNVRELRNIVERAYLYGSGDAVRPDDLPPEVAGRQIAGESFDEKVEEFRRQLIADALAESGGNQREAARSLHMTYDQFRYYYRKYSP